MKKLVLLFAAVATLFTACKDDCDHETIEGDYSKDIVGTWTCLKNGLAEALVFKADGSFESVGVANGEYWEELNARWELKNNKLTLSAGDYKSEVSLEIIPGKSLALVDVQGKRNVFEYCANDLSDEVVGMWVCTQTDLPESNMTIQTYQEDGKVVVTGFSPSSNSFVTNRESTYKVVGDLMIQKSIGGMGFTYFPTRLTYTPNGTAYGDILSTTAIPLIEDEYIEATYSWLRIKQNLDLASKNYDYSKIFVTNVKGEDKEFEFFNTTLNFANLDNSVMDKFLKATLFSVNFPNANTISYKFLEGEQFTTLEAPIVVEENKMTIKMSANKNAYRDVVVYAFQDVDDCQLHFYMPTDSFENFFANMLIQRLEESQDLDINDEVAVAEIHNNVKNAIQSINFSIVFKAAGK